MLKYSTEVEGKRNKPVTRLQSLNKTLNASLASVGGVLAYKVKKLHIPVSGIAMHLDLQMLIHRAAGLRGIEHNVRICRDLFCLSY